MKVVVHFTSDQAVFVRPMIEAAENQVGVGSAAVIGQLLRCRFPNQNSFEIRLTLISGATRNRLRDAMLREAARKTKPPLSSPSCRTKAPTAGAQARQP